MSAISAEPMTVVAPDLEVRSYLRTPTPRELDQPLPRPRIAPSPKVRTRTAANRKVRSVSTVGIVLTKMALFGAIAFPTWFASNLAGQVMTASAHKEWKQAYERAESATKATSALRGQVIELTSDQTAEQWASEHQMVASDSVKTHGKENSQLFAINR